MRFQKKFLILLFAGLFVSACKQLPVPDNSYYPYTKSQQAQLEQIKKSGATVIRQGDKLFVSLPVDYYFYPASLRLRSKGEEILPVVASFLKSYKSAYPRRRIEVAGHADNVFVNKKAKDLSYNYASIIASFLWVRGVPAHVIRIEAKGSDVPVSSFNPLGNAENRRVDILVTG